MFAKFLLSPLSGYLAVVMATVVLGLSVALWNAERRLGNAQEEIGTLRAEVSLVADANDSTIESLDACLSINAENNTQWERAGQLAAEAAERIVTLTAEFEAMNEPITTNDTDCRTLADPLPADFVAQLCIDGAANCIQD